jgi:lysyl-tRNA synthetase class 2
VKSDLLARRSCLFHEIRLFFRGRGFLETDTPVLAPFLIPEPSFEVFSTHLLSDKKEDKKLFLVPSPELWMKRLLASGSPDIFQVSRCFRNAEPDSGIHLHEFTMLEWYARNKNCEDNIGLTQELVGHLRIALGLGEMIKCRGREVSLALPFDRISMKQAFEKYAGLDLDLCKETEELHKAALNLGLMTLPDDSWEILFNRIFLLLVEPNLPMNKPIFVTDYPAKIRTLAKQKPGGLYSERWELYIAGLEIANCYTEAVGEPWIADFFEEEHERKNALCREIHPNDTGLADILSKGMLPACSGAALGCDRLLMVLLGAENIQEVLPFPPP